MAFTSELQHCDIGRCRVPAELRQLSDPSLARKLFEVQPRQFMEFCRCRFVIASAQGYLLN
jgi:hypothetical protein